MPNPILPSVPKSSDRERQRFDGRVKETLDRLTGRLGTAIDPLDTSASTAEIIDKINELIDLLQGND